MVARVDPDIQTITLDCVFRGKHHGMAQVVIFTHGRFAKVYGQNEAGRESRHEMRLCCIQRYKAKAANAGTPSNHSRRLGPICTRHLILFSYAIQVAGDPCYTAFCRLIERLITGSGLSANYSHMALKLMQQAGTITVHFKRLRARGGRI